MEHINRCNVHDFCRACLNQLQKPCLVSVGNTEKYNIHQIQDLKQWLEECTSLTIDQNDGLPKCVCQQCHDKLQQCHDFIVMCTSSARVLADLLSTEASKEKICEDLPNSAEIAEQLEEEVLSEINGNKEWLEFDFHGETKQQTEITNTEHEEVLVADPHETRLLLEESNGFNKGSKVDAELEIEMAAEITKVSDKTLAIVEGNNLKQSECCTLEDNLDGDDSEDEYLASSSSDFSEPETSIKRKSKRTIKSRRRSTRTRMKCKKIVSTSPKKFEVKFQCERCPRRCISQENLDAHMRVHQGLKPFQCMQCERSFNKGHHLRVHVQENHAEEQKEIICSYDGCDKVFRREASYRMHYRIKHADVKPENKTYVCEDCGRTYKNITMLREHRYKHAPKEEYPYQCEHCGKRYISQRTYKDHLLRHAGIKNFECPHCGMKKTTRNELRTHINYHTKEKQWPCPLCPSVFNSSANLGMHDRIVHKGIRRFVCRFCDQGFGKPDTLKHHEMRHTGERPHVCSICNKGFIQPVALRTHLKIHKKSNQQPDASQPLDANDDS